MNWISCPAKCPQCARTTEWQLDPETMQPLRVRCVPCGIEHDMHAEAKKHRDAIAKNMRKGYTCPCGSESSNYCKQCARWFCTMCENECPHVADPVCSCGSPAKYYNKPNRLWHCERHYPQCQN